MINNLKYNLKFCLACDKLDNARYTGKKKLRVLDNDTKD